MDDVVARVTQFARRHLPPDRATGPEDPEVDLVSAGLTSLALVGFIVDLESGFDIKFPPHAINEETFRSVKRVAEAVRALQRASTTI